MLFFYKDSIDKTILNVEQKNSFSLDIQYHLNIFAFLLILLLLSKIKFYYIQTIVEQSAQN